MHIYNCIYIYIIAYLRQLLSTQKVSSKRCLGLRFSTIWQSRIVILFQFRVNRLFVLFALFTGWVPISKIRTVIRLFRSPDFEFIILSFQLRCFESNTRRD